ncbi:MAG: DUF1616 domain-containing protein [Armatimonadota bacterium]|nr:DUF1616 domain-containing protein [Armatimonadota bacterium]
MRFLDDLLAVAAATAVLLVTIVLLPDSPIRIVLGLPFVLFFPGYTLIAALYPRRTDLDGVERLALSLGLSLAVVPLIGLVLNYLPWGIRLTPIITSLTLFIFACSLWAGLKRARLPASERFPADVRPVLAAVRALPWPAIILSAALGGALLFAGFRSGVLGGSRVGETFTEFYVLGPSGKAEGYPRVLFPGEPAEVILGVINHEAQAADYTIEVRGEGRLLRRIGPIRLADTAKWEEKVTFSLRRPADRVKVEFLLFRPGTPAPYRSLHLWVRVRGL